MAYETEVARGIALLDEKVPGWRARIDLDRLAITSCEDCILGQLYGDYGRGLAILDLQDGQEEGFFWGYDWDLEELEVAWRRALGGAP